MTKLKVKELIAEHLNLNISSVNDDSHLIHDLNGDSLDLVELVMALEESFGVLIEDEDAEKVQRVSDIYSILKVEI